MVGSLLSTVVDSILIAMPKKKKVKRKGGEYHFDALASANPLPSKGKGSSKKGKGERGQVNPTPI